MWSDKTNEKINEYLKMIELLPKIQKTKIYVLKEESSNDYFNSLKDNLEKIRESKIYKSIKNKIKKGNEKEKKTKEEEEKLSNSKILLLHLAIYEEIYNELLSKKNKLLKENLVSKKIEKLMVYITIIVIISCYSINYIANINYNESHFAY